MLAAVFESLTWGGDGRNVSSLPAWVVPLVFAVSVFARLLVASHPHSGENDPPRFGDYEAQRHWMEITIHTPLREWYVGTTHNDLGYWGLDYPPLTAYQSWVYGKVLHRIDPAIVSLTTSRGHESYGSKLLMRYTVIVSDIAFLLPALLVFHRTFTNKLAGKLSAGGTGAKSGERTDLAISKKFSAKTQKLSIAYAFTAAALSPAQMLIDHGHFQYNGISLGLSVYAAAAVISDWDVIGSILFTLALNHKQTAAYLSPAFFAFLLGKSLRNNSTSYTKVAAVLRLGIAVVGTFAVLWAPFYFAIDPETGTADGVRGVKTVFQRLVPFKRGLYEDYVSNVWCFTNPFFKWKTWLSIETATRLALLCTVTAIAPAVAHQIKKPSNEGFVWCLVNCGFGFFLWSFQVHEKSALFFTTPVALLVSVAPDFSTWLPQVVCFSMWPLLRRDNLHVAYVGVVLLYTALVGGGAPSPGASPLSLCAKEKVSLKEKREKKIWRGVRLATVAVVVGTHVLQLVVPPPTRFPYLHDLVVTSLSTLAFFGAACYSNLKQMRVPADEDGPAAPKPRKRSATRSGAKNTVTEESSDDRWSLVKLAATPVAFGTTTTRRRKAK